MRRAAILTAVAGLLAILAGAVASTTREAFTLGVTPIGVAADLLPGDEACQRGVQAPPGASPASAVRLRGRATGADPTRFAVRVDGAGGTGRMAAADGADATVRLDREVSLRRPGVVCVRNLGPYRLQLFGSGAVAARTSELRMGDEVLPTDLTIVFERAPRPRLSRFGELAERARLWRAGWVGAWTVPVLLALVALGGPVLLLRGLRQRRP